ncbi:MAG: zinc ribbon domain-containing protein [Gemmatimonadaceae bacterium]|nr:zinc ribbon domain-containing protein [Gemmatimonadaceae bacterium]
MDDLDRLYRRLVLNVRASAPQFLGASFEVAQLYQELVPYRTSRRELGFTAVDEYELALCQLLAGSRGLLDGDAEMQAALRRELESPNPDLSAYRAFATATVRFVEAPLREAMLRPTPDEARAAGAAAASPIEHATLAGRPTEKVETPPASPPPDRHRDTARPPALPPEPPPAPTLSPAEQRRAPAAPQDPAMPVSRPNPIRPRSGEACHYCGTGLPEGRSITFCPGCGHNLTIQHCPACNTELEVGWKFCVTCGRQV